MAFREIVQTVRASAVLAPAGAFDASPTEIVCNTYHEASFQIGYTRGGAGGAIGYRVEFSNDKITWGRVCDFQAAAIAPGADVVVSQQGAQMVYTATGVTQEFFMSPTFTVAGKFMRIVPRETGAVGTPGTAVIQVYLRGDF